MKHIVWQSEWQELVDSFQNRSIAMNMRGGPTYEYHAALALEANYKVTMDKLTARRLDDNPFSYWYRLYKNKIEGDVFVKSRSVVTHSSRRRNWSAVEIGIIHHIYLDKKRNSLKGRLSLINLTKRLRELDLVVSVSEYWADYFKEIGCKKVKVIYNAFNLDEFNISEEEIIPFLKENNIRGDRPLIHIGYANSTKGVIEVYNALKDEDYTLVMTGPLNKSPDLPVRCLFLNRYDYLCLLKACDVVVTMSKVREGWSRIAHEAMLCRTPVVGSGSGGMRELLEGGGQVICEDISTLPDLINEVLNKKGKYAFEGFKFASRFDHEYFAREWNVLVKEAVGDD